MNEEVTEAKVEELRKRDIKELQASSSSTTSTCCPSLRDTLMLDKIASPEEAIMEIYRRLRPGDPPTPETATSLFINLFFNAERYDLSKVGRLKLNYKFGIDEPLDNQVLTKRDILEVVRFLIDLKNGKLDKDEKRRTSTTSTTSATAGCARSASCWRTSTASAWCAWSAPSRSA